MHKTACSSDFHSTYIHIQSWLTLPIPSEIVIKNGHYNTHMYIKTCIIRNHQTKIYFWPGHLLFNVTSNDYMHRTEEIKSISSCKTWIWAVLIQQDPYQDVSHYHISARLYVTSIDEFDFWSHIPLGKSTRIWVWLSWPFSAEIQSHMITRK